MAKNENTGWSNENTCYVAMSGYGKSQALRQNPDIPSRGARVFLWDTDNDHATRSTHYFSNWHQYTEAVLAGMKSGEGFRLAWNGLVDVKIFEAWCQLVWECLNGDRRTYIIIEELADISPGAGKATFWFGQINRKCRKYGGILHWTTQKSQEVSKTAYSQAAVKYIGFPNEDAPPSTVAHLARIAGVESSELLALNELEFYRRAKKETVKLALKYKA